MKNGIAAAIAAYLIWGLSPLYWKSIHNIPAIEIIGHRVLWSWIFVALVMGIQRNWFDLRTIAKQWRNNLIYIVTASLLAVNWLVYIWAVNQDYIVDASLGYFINPLVNVVLGVVFFRERLRVWQWIPVGIAGTGVLYLTLNYGALPWVGLVLALSFGFYGMLKKKSNHGSLHSFSLEMSVLLLPALVLLVSLEFQGTGVFGHLAFWETGILVMTGIITGVPLLLFGLSARQVDLSTLGFIQYLAPTMQFLIGVLVYGELFSPERWIGFGLIWLALLVYTAETFHFVQRRKAALHRGHHL